MSAKITKVDTDGVITAPNTLGDMSIDNHVAGGDAGRMYYNDGTSDIAVAKLEEVTLKDSDQSLAAGDAIDITGQTLTLTKGNGDTETAEIPVSNAPIASETVSGTVELATTEETVAGTDTTRAVTPAGLNEVAGNIEGRLSTTACSVLLKNEAILEKVKDFDETTDTTTAVYAVGEYIANTTTGQMYECLLINTVGILLTNTTYFTAVTTNSLTVTDGGYIYTDGKNLDGSFNKTSEVVSGVQSFDLVGVSDGMKYLAREYGTGTLKAYDEVGNEPNGTNLWFNVGDGTYYESTKVIEASGSLNTSTIDSVPTMTSDTSPSGTVSASGIVSTTYASWKAFADNGSAGANGWQTSPSFPVWLQYEFATSKVINKYSITPNENELIQSPNSWTIEASNTGTFTGEETVLDTVTNYVFTSGVKYFTFSNSTPFRYYRINISANNGSGTSVGIGEMKYIEAQEEIQDGTPLAKPISFLSIYPYMIVSETPQFEMTNEAPIPVNVMDSLTVRGLTSLDDNVKIIDFSTVFSNNRYVIDNPFGNENAKGCTVKAEILYKGIWSETGWGEMSASSSGVKAFSNDEGVVVQTGHGGVEYGISSYNGSGFGDTVDVRTSSAPCRVIVTYHGKAKEI